MLPSPWDAEQIERTAADALPGCAGKVIGAGGKHQRQDRKVTERAVRAGAET